MVDLPPLTISMPLMTTAAGAAPVDTIALTVDIKSAPAAFTQLNRTVEINGTISNLLNNGQIEFQTAAGILTLKATAIQEGLTTSLAELLTPLVQNQKPLALVIQPGKTPQQAILNIPAPASPTAESSPANASTPAAKPMAVPGMLTPGQTLKAVLLPQGVAEAFAPSVFKNIHLSTPVSMNATTTRESFATPVTTTPSGLTETGSPANSGGFLSLHGKLSQLAEFLKASPAPEKMAETHAPSLAAASTVPVVKNAPIAPQAVQQANAPELPPPGAPLNVRLEAAYPPNVSCPATDDPQQMIATVVGKGPDGQLLLSTGQDSLFIRQGSNFPEGTKLVFRLLPPDPEPDLTLPPVDGSDAPAMQRAMTALAQVEPVLAQQVMQRHIPQPNEILPSTLLLLFNAIQEGGVHGWLRSIADGQFNKASKLELVAAMAEEMNKAGGLARDTMAGQWQTWPIPLYDGSHFQMLRLYVRHDHDRRPGTPGRTAPPNTRFLINMQMSQLGPLQIDGLSAKKQLDLILRSEAPLPAYLPNELRTLYIRNLEALGLAGSLTFQTGRSHWIEIQKAEPVAGVVT